MTLAARHKSLPVLLGAILSFALLNLIAVTLGATAAAWLPRWLVLACVALLFLVFGYQSFRNDDDEEVGESLLSGRSIVISAFLLVFFAEFGDKTQLAVAGLGSAEDPLAVWLGSTAALAAITVIGVLAGQTLMRYVSLQWIHRASGILFVAFGLVATGELVSLVV